MKWLLGGFVLWIVFNGRFAQYAALVATAAAPASSGANVAGGNAGGNLTLNGQQTGVPLDGGPYAFGPGAYGLQPLMGQ